MKGYWHFPALAAAAAICAVYSQQYWIIFSFIFWLFYLFHHELLGKWTIIISLAVLIFFSFYIPSLDKGIATEHSLPSETSLYNGQITGPVTITDDKVEFVFSEKHSHHDILILYFPDDNEESIRKNPKGSYLKSGAECQLTGLAELPEEIRNPGQFDYRRYLETRGIAYQLIVDSLADIQCTGSGFLNRFYMLRESLLLHVEETLSDFTASWLSGIVFGDDSMIDKDTEEVFQRWSLSHIIAISGSNIGLIVALFYFLLLKLNILTREKAEWVMIALLPVYALLAGGEPSVWRAASMIIFLIFLNKSRFRFSYTDILSIVFLLLILFDKHIVYHIGFQLSFLVTFAILLSRKWINQTSSPFWQVLQISFVSQMAIIPVQFAYFSIFQPLSIILNLLIVPYFTLLAIPFMYILLPLTFLPHSIVSLLDGLFAYVHRIVIGFIEYIDETLFFPLLMDRLPSAAATLYFVLFFLFMMNLQRKKLYRSIQAGTLMCFLIAGIAARPYFSSSGVVTMLDIGQGDAFVIELPYRKGVLLIDAGAGFSFDNMEATETIYDQILKPYLYSRGIRNIDALFLTHEDLDHTGSVPSIIDEMHVEKIIVSHHFDEALLDEFSGNQKKVDVRRVGQGDTILIGGHQFHVIAPGMDLLSANENSLVLYSPLGGKDWLFTGDIGQKAERELMRNYPDMTVDILKVAHHGSNTSTEQSFLDTVNPSTALISVAENNSYGHPGSEVLDRLREKGITILRTDRYGAVQYFYDQDDGTFFTFLP
ncbi:DNA internalization-related competence protein ComEC/Rec2 [Oceanobacillus massiliensis]|uniref:DNA internalization-related competence protein ComEC/Rec2 n=1 Tax=Oceanobacillus massiliensis TaxID=1465765 RepID=UPI000289FFB8|nr:DNA internalization-related competence protein ComEC/Rec2 [Oceanobacillus massiliensis]